MTETTLFNDILEKASEGGFTRPNEMELVNTKPIFMNFKFWKALGRACQWAGINDEHDRKMTLGEYTERHYIAYAMRFHKITLDENGGFDRALENLHSVIFKVIHH